MIVVRIATTEANKSRACRPGGSGRRRRPSEVVLIDTAPHTVRMKVRLPALPAIREEASRPAIARPQQTVGQ